MRKRGGGESAVTVGSASMRMRTTAYSPAMAAAPRLDSPPTSDSRWRLAIAERRKKREAAAAGRDLSDNPSWI
jgi:hypothetical protein